jgi:hypothetical protein
MAQAKPQKYCKLQAAKVHVQGAHDMPWWSIPQGWVDPKTATKIRLLPNDLHKPGGASSLRATFEAMADLETAGWLATEVWEWRPLGCLCMMLVLLPSVLKGSDFDELGAAKTMVAIGDPQSMVRMVSAYARRPAKWHWSSDHTCLNVSAAVHAVSFLAGHSMHSQVAENRDALAAKRKAYNLHALHRMASKGELPCSGGGSASPSPAHDPSSRTHHSHVPHNLHGSQKLLAMYASSPDLLVPGGQSSQGVVAHVSALTSAAAQGPAVGRSLAALGLVGDDDGSVGSHSGDVEGMEQRGRAPQQQRLKQTSYEIPASPELGKKTWGGPAGQSTSTTATSFAEEESRASISPTSRAFWLISISQTQRECCDCRLARDYWL